MSHQASEGSCTVSGGPGCSPGRAPGACRQNRNADLAVTAASRLRLAWAVRSSGLRAPRASTVRFLSARVGCRRRLSRPACAPTDPPSAGHTGSACAHGILTARRRRRTRPRPCEPMPAEQPNEPESRRSPRQSAIIAGQTNPPVVRQPNVAPCRPSPVPFRGVAGTDSHGPMDPPKRTLRHHG
jgi:hypothetical protein